MASTGAVAGRQRALMVSRPSPLAISPRYRPIILRFMACSVSHLNICFPLPPLIQSRFNWDLIGIFRPFRP